ncbi:MAG TPA: phosphate signaling complex protein PhoU [Candidatus Dormibacteraeota bacterium]|nr:phosphate signaling complex protein PhoU [Candidatus Dormibacteraeota bacterium]
MGRVVALVFEVAQASVPAPTFEEGFAELAQRLVDKFSLGLEEFIESPPGRNWYEFHRILRQQARRQRVKASLTAPVPFSKVIDPELLRLGSLVEAALGAALTALSNRDLALADQVVRDDLAVNELRYKLEEQYTARLSRADGRDTRPLVAALFLLAELERMGDHAEGIAKVALMLGPEPSLPLPTVITALAEKTVSMVKRTLQALEREDAQVARVLCGEDDEIDALYDRAYQELISTMIANPDRIAEATYALWVTHNLERIADRATNVCERVVYLVTGRVEELNVSKY